MVRRLLVSLSVLAVVVAGAAVAQQGGCPMHAGAKAGAKAAAVKATTPAQKAYLAEAKRLHGVVVQKRTELKALQAKKADAAAVKAKQGELGAARKKLHAYNVENKSIRTALGLKDCSTCPKAGSCDGCPGTGCEQCADCPTGGPAKGGCPMSGAASSKAKPAAGGCPMAAASAKAKPAAGGCPMHAAAPAKAKPAVAPAKH